MNVEFLAEVKEELNQEVEYYERKEVAHVLTRIASDPLLWRERPGGYRRVNCPVFPCYVAYIIRSDLVVVVAIASSHRHPDYWKKRLNT